MVAGGGSATVRGRLARRLQHFASTGERASGDGKGNGPLSAGGVEWEADDADSRTAVGRREHDVMSLAQRRAVPRAAVAIACRGGDRVALRASGRNGVRFGLCGGDQGTVAKLSVVAVAGGPVVAGTRANASR